MTGGIINVILGAILIAGGASGKLVLIGTNSSLGIAVIGGVFVVLGAYRIVRARRRSISR